MKVDTPSSNETKLNQGRMISIAWDRLKDWDIISQSDTKWQADRHA